VAGPPEDAGQARPATGGHDASRRPHLSWTSLVVASAAALLLIALAIAIWWAATEKTRIATYTVRGSLVRVELDLHSGGAEITEAGGNALQVRRTDKYAFDRSSQEKRSVRNGVLRISSRCPTVVVGGCSTSYRLAVPENVPIVVRTRGGDIRIGAFRGSADLQTDSGAVNVDGFCGFALTIKTGSGDARASASCSPQNLDLRSSTGDLEATVPTGGYRIDADSNSGRREVSGIEPNGAAPYEIRALSDSGDVSLRGGG
jgi:hypothetical protein